MGKCYGALAAALLILGSCNGDSDDGFTSTSTVVLPVANAGIDAETLPSTLVTLNGSKSYDPQGGTLTYEWGQTAGTAVALSNPALASPTFTAPASTGDLTFRLRVLRGSDADTDNVTITVKSMIVTAPDTWFVGYEKSGSITATVTGGTGPFTYEWTGIEAWISTSGSATAVLSYTTPRLSDFQNFPDRAEVAVLEKTSQGRLQLKIKVTDAVGAIDEDFVNFSAGPFSDTVAHENVAFGEPVFLNGGATTTSGTITSWTWTGTKPNGASISFFKPDKSALAGATDQRHVYFVPDLVGDYQLIVTQNPGAIVKVVDIVCGRFVGVGSLTGRTPDPFAGECAACHAGQLSWVADFANPWLGTGHAQMFERILDPSNLYYATSQSKGHWLDAFNFGSSYSIDSRAVGWSRITSGTSGGWTESAVSDGYVFPGTTWDELVRKHPNTAAKSNVQCESCHGPGSEHAGDASNIRKSYDAALCGRCHSRKQDLWEVSGHGSPPITSPSGNANCNNCHTAQGFVVDLRAQEGADPHPVLFATSNIHRPVIPYEDRRGTTCQACHEPHKKTAKRPAAEMDPQLRAWGNVQFLNGAAADFGEAAVCAMCHQSRTDTRDNSLHMNTRRAPHDSTAAEMLAGTNAPQFSDWTYNVSPHGIATRFVTPGGSENRRCVACHVDIQPGKGSTGYNALGGHTFNMKQGSGAAVADNTTHLGAATVAGTKKFTVASGTGFLKRIFTGDLLTISAGADVGTYTISSVDTARQVTVLASANFTGGAATTWNILSTVKYNTAACTQCHTVASDFHVVARGDYDGDGTVEDVQDEIGGLEAALLSAINAKLSTLVAPGYSVTVSGGRIRYTNGSITRVFPGPSVTSGENPDLAWSSLSTAVKQNWLDLYRAAYNYYFVVRDHSEGIHNTGYAVNLLQSAVKAVTGTTIGQPFVPF